MPDAKAETTENADSQATEELQDYERLKYVKLIGMNDSVVTYDRLTTYSDGTIAVPFKIQYATPDIQDVKLSILQPIKGREPDNSQDRAWAPRTSRYRVISTEWGTKGGTQEDPLYPVTVTIAPNANNGIDDGYSFVAEDWAKYEDPTKHVRILSPIGDSEATVLSASVQGGNLVVQLEVRPREAENVITYVEFTATAALTSGKRESSLDIAAITLLKPKDATDTGNRITNKEEIQEAIGNTNYDPKTTSAVMRPEADYVFSNGSFTAATGSPDSDEKKEIGKLGVSVTNLERSQYTYDLTDSGYLHLNLDLPPINDITIRVHTDGEGTYKPNPDLISATAEDRNPQTLEVYPSVEAGYSLTGTVADLEHDAMLEISDTVKTVKGGYSYEVKVASPDVTIGNPADLTIKFTPNDITLPRDDAFTVTVDGAAYTAGAPVKQSREWK